MINSCYSNPINADGGAGEISITAWGLIGSLFLTLGFVIAWSYLCFTCVKKTLQDSLDAFDEVHMGIVVLYVKQRN